MEKAIAYLFGNRIIGTVKLTDVGDCVLYEIDIKNVQTDELVLLVDDHFKIIDFSYMPFLCRGRIRISFYSDAIAFKVMLGKKISLNSGDTKIAEGNTIKVYPGKRFYAEMI